MRPTQFGAGRSFETAKESGGTDRSNDAGRTCVLVLGMHRSGTSALTAALSKAGTALPRTLLGPRRGNEGGHCEPETLVHCHDRLLDALDSHWHDWRPLNFSCLLPDRKEEFKREIATLLADEFGDAPLFVVKDPRICRFAPLFIEVLEESGFDVRIVLISRNPLEVADSLEKRDGFPRMHTLLLWLRHVLDGEAATRSRIRIFISYQALLDSGSSTLDRISEVLGITWPAPLVGVADQIDDFLSSTQRHHVRSDVDVRRDLTLGDWVREAYSALLALEVDPYAQEAMLQLETVRREFDRATPVLTQLQLEPTVLKPQKPTKLRRLAQRLGLDTWLAGTRRSGTSNKS